MEQEFVDMEVQEAPSEPEIIPEGENDAEPAEQQQEEKREQSLEERAGFAAARRKAEAEYSARLMAEKARMDNYAKLAGFESWDKMEQETSRSQLSDAGIKPEALIPIINQAVEQHPSVKAAQEVQASTVVNRFFDEFKANYPDSGIKSVEDFAQMENYEQFYQYVCNGLSFSDAYLLSNKDSIITKKTTAAKQAALNAVNGKQHMRSTTGDASADTVHIPDETYQMYKDWFPGWTDKQIRAHYAQSKKG